MSDNKNPLMEKVQEFAKKVQKASKEGDKKLDETFGKSRKGLHACLILTAVLVAYLITHLRHGLVVGGYDLD